MPRFLTTNLAEGARQTAEACLAALRARFSATAGYPVKLEPLLVAGSKAARTLPLSLASDFAPAAGRKYRLDGIVFCTSTARETVLTGTLHDRVYLYTVQGRVADWKPVLASKLTYDAASARDALKAASDYPDVVVEGGLLCVRVKIAEKSSLYVEFDGTLTDLGPSTP